MVAYVPLAGSEMQHPPGSVVQGAAPREQRLSLVLLLLRPALASEHPLVRKREQIAILPLRQRPLLSRAELAELNGAPADQVQRVTEFARDAGLEVLEASPVRNDVVLAGPISRIEAALGIELRIFSHAEGDYRGYFGPVFLPAPVAEAVSAVLGLGTVPHFRTHQAPAASRPPTKWLTPPQIAAMYRFPAGGGDGQRVAIVQLGGGFHPSDMAEYFAQLGLQLPTISSISVADADGRGKNAPLASATCAAIAGEIAAGRSMAELFRAHGSDTVTSYMGTLETTMDVQIVGAIANRSAIDVYFASNTLAGLRNAIWAALGEPVGGGAGDARQPPAVISISWGACECAVGASYLSALEAALTSAADRGVTVCCSTGDAGSRDTFLGAPSQASVNFPASSPHALACGGTFFKNLDDPSQGEVVWNQSYLGGICASGGGFSGFFPRPAYQGNLAAAQPPQGTWVSPGNDGALSRAVPDVAGYADPVNGYQIRLGGTTTSNGGTSAATPLWAALVVLLGGALGRPVGWLHPLLYRPEVQATFTDITAGDNDVSDGKLLFYSAAVGWDACTGLGTPNGQALLAALR